MINTKNKLILSVALLANAILWTGCSDDFLKEKTDYSKLTPEIYNDYTGAKMRVDDIYLRLLPDVNNGLSYRSTSSGKGDIQSRSTEEFSSLSDFVNPDVVVTSSSNLADWFHVSKNTNSGPWGEIRNCNDAIEGISKGTLADEQKRELLGQVYFFRAWQYYLLVKTYGGVPIVDKVQLTDVSEATDLIVPRSTAKVCIDFICNDLDTAAAMLPYKSGDFGRVTKGAALALAGRARLLYASPLFNRADDESRWKAAYEANQAAITALNAGGFNLAYQSAPGVNAAGWSKMFSDFNSSEAVFVTLYNKVHDDDAAHEIYRNNHWEQTIRPKNTNATTSNSGMTPSAMMVDLFPMADGKKPGQSEYAYNPLTFFANRDPRFYRTFAFPGVYWRFEGNPKMWPKYDSGGNVIGNLDADYPYSGENYVLWNYSWYDTETNRNDETKIGFGADLLGTNYRGVYVRKRSNDFDMTSPAPTCLYRWPATSSENRQGAFGEAALPWMEIRYAEVLLNFAEAACGYNRLTEAKDALIAIRQRAGIPAGSDGSYGLGDLSTRSEMFAAILYERQVELAYEGKRFDDMRRWLLWDGGANFSQIANAPSTWTLSGFGGNTCTYLGVEPLNGKRRDNFEICAKTNASASHASDPLKTVRPLPLDLKTDATTTGNTTMDNLVTFYTTYLMRKQNRGDEVGKVIDYKPQYYFIGLTSGAQSNNTSLLQTIGWADTQKGNQNGTFDPLAE